MNRRQRALLVTEGYLDLIFAKTAHGVLRGPCRFEIVGVVDSAHAGRSVGDVLPELERGASAGVDGARNAELPVFHDVAEAVGRLRDRDAAPAEVLVVGVATPGGALSQPIREVLLDGARRGMTLVNGLHQLLEDDEEIRAAVEASGGALADRLVDVRKPPPARELRFWTGDVMRCTVPRVPVVGIDCAVGKRTTCSLLQAELATRGVRASMIYTGQTGWLQGWTHGLIFDSIPNDFVCGELERAILDCAEAETPDLILIEGQSGLRNPSGPCGGELLLAAGAAGCVLQVVPGRVAYKGFKSLAADAPMMRLPTSESEVELIRSYGVEVWGLGVHPEGLSESAADTERDRLRGTLGLPVVLPFRDGVGELADGVVEQLGLAAT